MAEIRSVVTAHPQHRVGPEELKAYIRSALSSASAERFTRIVDRSDIRSRHTVAPLAELCALGSLEERAQLYVAHSLALGEDVARRALAESRTAPDAVTTLISVTSTGYMAPSLDAYLVDRLGLRSSVRRVPISQLGCSGGVSAIATAADLIGAANGTALVVSVEICSLCLQSRSPSRTDLIASVLFGDGAAAAVLSSSAPSTGPEIVASRSVLLKGSAERVGMQLSAVTGLRLVLSRDMPAIVRDSLPRLVDGFLHPHSLSADDISFWLVHPGGPRVLDAVEHCFALPRGALDHSWEVWHECGNMSSATSLFVLDRWLRGMRSERVDGFGLMIAFGPGVSCEMILLKRRARIVPMQTDPPTNRDACSATRGSTGLRTGGRA
jgi:alkylresorcinol/alkylpyrone synthase